MENWSETSSAKAAIIVVARHCDAFDTDGDIATRQVNAARAFGDWAIVGLNYGSKVVVASASRGIEAQGRSCVDVLGRA